MMITITRNSPIRTLLGLDKFKEKSARRRERKKRAKAKKRAATSAGRSAGASDPSRMVQTEASRLLGLSGEVDVVEHLDGRRKRKRKEEEEEEETVGTAKGSSRKEVSMKQARFDVYKFGVSGFGRTEREDAEVASLVRLGAKPPKKKRVDYPQLKEERKAERERERERREMERLSGLKNVVGRGKAKGKEEKAKATKKKGSDSLQAKVGKFNGGMLRLSAKDILKIKSGRK